MTTTLTPRQQQVLHFIRRTLDADGQSPSLREIAQHFGFKSMKAAADHVTALRRKGALEHRPRRARSLRVISPFQALRRRVVDVPIYGAIPAGRPDHREQHAQGCISADVESLGIRPTTRTFALQVRGDSMIGKHIVDGDYVILEHGKAPRHGDVVAALIDNESTLKTFVVENRRAYLKAENPRYPKLIPAEELVVQGVMVALVRKAEGGRQKAE